MTEKLYYQDPYRKEFTATVVQLCVEENAVRVRLDQTAFYPEGGGQGADHGVLETADGVTARVLDVQEKDGDIWHLLDQPVKEGSAVTGRLDWDRRFDHMQQHSGEHIVSGMICRQFQCDNVGFHLGEDVVTIDFNTRISMEQAQAIEQMANAYIWEDHPFEELWPSQEELKTLPYRSKKELSGSVRITRFPGADSCACCGTHVSGSAQIGLVKFLSAKNFHEGTRLELLCGRRAADFLSMNYRVNKQTAVLLSTSEENSAVYVGKVLEENIRLKTALSELQERMFHMQAEAFRDKGNVLVIEEHLDAVRTRELADIIAASCGAMAAVFSRADGRYHYAVIQKDADISSFIREMNQALQGRGGGRNGFAQGSVSAEKAEIESFFQGFFR